MLFLVQIEHEKQFVTTHLIQAEDAAQAEIKLQNYLAKEYAIKDSHWQIDSEGKWFRSSEGNRVTIKTFAKLASPADVTNYLPFIG